ncbi:hypothetical protein AB0D65_32055 [Streptomyces griseoloalbus]|uniref:Uncharacterized protein n=1 Tax=Streptomyces griseoloalbus TaxID=67303 RepID=A0ABV3EED2_9ACTN
MLVSPFGHRALPAGVPYVGQDRSDAVDVTSALRPAPAHPCARAGRRTQSSFSGFGAGRTCAW